MARCAFDGTIGRAVEAYTGCKLFALEALPDPNQPAFAVRAVVIPRSKARRDNVELFFLIRVPLQHVTAGELEEVEFTQWPPTVRS